MEIVMDFDIDVDTRGLNCPIPVMKLKKALTEAQSGQVIKIVGTDPGTVKDFEAFSKQTGNPILSSSTAGKEFVFFRNRL